MEWLKKKVNCDNEKCIFMMWYLMSFSDEKFNLDSPDEIHVTWIIFVKNRYSQRDRLIVTLIWDALFAKGEAELVMEGQESFRNVFNSFCYSIFSSNCFERKNILLVASKFTLRRTCGENLTKKVHIQGRQFETKEPDFFFLI